MEILAPYCFKEHRGKFVAIKNKKVLGIYGDYMEAAERCLH